MYSQKVLERTATQPAVEISLRPTLLCKNRPPFISSGARRRSRCSRVSGRAQLGCVHAQKRTISGSQLCPKLKRSSQKLSPQLVFLPEAIVMVKCGSEYLRLTRQMNPLQGCQWGLGADRAVHGDIDAGAVNLCRQRHPVDEPPAYHNIRRGNRNSIVEARVLTNGASDNKICFDSRTIGK